MNILLQGYLDRNFGDDMMIRIVADKLREHSFFISERKKELLLPFSGDKNIFDLDKHPDARIDAVLRVVGSGFMIRNYAGLYYSIRCLMSRGTKKIKSAVLGCNIGPFYGKLAERVSVREMARHDLITVRDTVSLKFLNDNLKNIKTAYYPDILFSLPDMWLAPVTGEDCLGISAYRRNANNLDTYVEMSEIADWYISGTGKNVLLFAFDTEDENDLSAAYTIKGLCKYPDKVEIVPHTGNGDNIIHGFSRCKTIIAVRFHSLILALRMGLRVIPVTYSDKTKNMLCDLGYTGISFNLDKIDAESIKQAIEKDGDGFKINPDVFRQAEGHVNTFVETILKD
ncbi:MAG: polysaccharide pyruvyl transferase family protein [Clostridiales bacterium]|nr:polysaccharide pyruvyl transferase family protein [Clostridiales bacterium]